MDPELDGQGRGARHYRAFISYAHVDERWARWLQRALETYRIPRTLVGRAAGQGPVPRRFRPVFRDREDLGSAADLTEKVAEALSDSDNLIVICSPAAANSRWVNEEIRRFRALGRANRIHCLIVDGDPQADGDDACFPPALLEDGGVEPLAADARKYADGKALALLKLLSGALGIRLDDLRRRDHQRRQRRAMIVTAASLAIVLVMAVLAILAIQARNEADDATERRLAGYDYLLGDLRSKLAEVGRLDLLEDVSAFIAADGEERDIDNLTDEELEDYALAWRELGKVHRSRYEYPEALDMFQRSRDVFWMLSERHPEDRDHYFELGQAEFWVGYVHHDRADFESSIEHMEIYLEVSDQLVEMEPENPVYLSELAWAHGNLSTIERKRVDADFEHMIFHANAAVEHMRQALALSPDSEFLTGALAGVYADLGDAQRRTCDIGGAYRSRLESLAMSRELLERAPRDASRREDVASALSGVGHIERLAGNWQRALESFRQSEQMARQLAELDPGNTDAQWYWHAKRFYLARMQSEVGHVEPAWETLNGLESSLDALADAETEVHAESLAEYGDYKIDFAQLAAARGEVERAGALLDEGTAILAQLARDRPQLHKARSGIAWALTGRWLLGMSPPPADWQSLALDATARSTEELGCSDAELAMRQSVMAGDEAAARQYARFLRQRGYWSPTLVAFCAEYSVCEVEQSRAPDG